jgi:RimJ/RimL family protein N-acetyltransferase
VRIIMTTTSSGGVAAAVAEQSAEVAGYTCLEAHESRPDLAIQQDTTVLATHRGRGLGAWIKSANVIGLTRNHPAVRRVRTSNAADNVPMMRVNRQLGFTEEMTMENREERLADLRALNNSAASGRAGLHADPRWLRPASFTCTGAASG